MNDEEIIDFIAEESDRLGIDEPQVSMKKMEASFGLAGLRQWEIILNKSWCHKSGDIIVKQLISNITRTHASSRLLDTWFFQARQVFP